MRVCGGHLSCVATLTCGLASIYRKTGVLAVRRVEFPPEMGHDSLLFNGRRIETGEYGKPYFADAKATLGLKFNLSHSNQLALIAISRDREIGVDIEYIRPNFVTDEVAGHFFSPAEAEVLRLVREQGLPGRQTNAEWRFSRNAIHQWLGQPLSTAKTKGIWAAAGSWKDDPYLDDLLKEIYRRRGRPMIEED